MAEFCMTVCMSMSFSVKTNENHPKQNCCPSAVSWTTFQTESCKATGFHTDRHRHFSMRGVGGACGSDRRGLVLRPDNQCPLGGVTTKASDQLLVSFFLGQGKEKKKPLLASFLVSYDRQHHKLQHKEARHVQEMSRDLFEWLLTEKHEKRVP